MNAVYNTKFIKISIIYMNIKFIYLKETECLHSPQIANTFSAAM